MGDKASFNKELAARLRKKEDFLRKHVELEKDGILDRLKEAKILDEHDVERLKLHHLQRSAWEQLIRILPGKGDTAYHELKVALRRANKHDVVFELEKVQVMGEDLEDTESEKQDKHARTIARQWIQEQLVEAEGESVSLEKIHADLSEKYTAYTGMANPPTSKDLMSVAQLINPDLMMILAISHLNLEKQEHDLIRANCELRSKQEFHFRCLVKWQEKNGACATKEALYEILQKASSEDGMLDRSKLTFLTEQSSNVWGIFNITPEELCEMICEIYPVARSETTSKSDKPTSKTRLYNLQRRHHTPQLKERVADVPEPGMEKWTVAMVTEWLRKIECSDQVCEIFAEQEIDGFALRHLKMEQFKDISTSVKTGMKMRIIVSRDKEVAKENADAVPAHDSSVQKTDPDSIQEQLRQFDSTPKMTFKYKESAEVPEIEARPDDLTTPIHKFVDVPKILGGNDSIPKICSETVLFACACLNDHTNGTIHFGIKDQKICGVELGIGQNKVNGHLSSALFDAFDEDQHDIVYGCVRTAKFIEVIQSKGRNRSKKFVIEIDVRPDSECCGTETFYAKAPHSIWKHKNLTYDEPLVYRFNRQNESEPYALNHEALKEYQKSKLGLAHHRKQREEYEDQKSRNRAHPDLRRKLLEALGQDMEAAIRPDLYHLCILSPQDDDMDDSFIKENLDFVGTTEWKAAFDFDPDSKLCDYLVEDRKVPIKIISSTDKFDSMKAGPSQSERVRSLHEDLKNSADLSWIFCNGLKKAEVESAENGREWRRNCVQSFKECIRFFSREIPDDRAVVVFFLFSKNYDVMIEAASEFCDTFPDQFVCIAESDSIANPWKEKLLTKNCVDKDVLDANTVVGLPWGHVQEIFQSLTDPDLSTKPKLPTTSGTSVTLSAVDRESWPDLDVLAANECEDCDLIEEEYTRMQQNYEEKFYHGEQVSWWNFYFPNQVCKRSIHDQLKRRVEETLRGNIEDDVKVAKVTLYHEQGSGGTTAAKNALWDLKDQYRCAVVKDITEKTSSQILKFRAYRDEPKDLKPVLIMIDNADDERVSILLEDLELKGKRAAMERSYKPVCVLLVVTSRSKMKPKTKSSGKVPGKYEVLKHELDKQELLWFNKKHKELDGKFKIHKGADPKMMISFNILKENFSNKYIKQTTLSLLEAVTSPKERKLLKYLSLVGAYDITRQEVPTAAFDKLMKAVTPGFKQLKHWETGLSQKAKVLLNVSSKQAMRRIQVLSIIHPLFAKEIQEASRNKGGGYIESLSDSVLEFFAEGFVNPPPEKRDFSIDDLHTIIYNILVKRRRFSNTQPETKFSPLIEDILRNEDHNKAGEVLQEGFKLTGNAFVAQQVSRLFIHTKSWAIALEHAKIAVEMKVENPCLWDTLGRVYRDQVNDKLAEYSEREAGSIPEKEILETMSLCLESIKHFKKSQEVALEEKSSLENEVVGYIGELDASVRMLDCLTCMEFFQHNRQKSRQFLVNLHYIPQEIAHWKDVDGINYIEELKKLQPNVTEVIGKIEDEQIQHKLETIDEYKGYAAKTVYKSLERLKENIDSYFGENSDEVPDDLTEEGKRMYRRRRILSLGGYSLRGIYDMRKNEDGAKKLLKIVELADVNLLSSLPTHAEDLRFKITAILALSMIPGNSYTNQLKMADMIELSTMLYTIKRNFRPTRLEPYLFYVMFGWPRECTEGMGLSPPQILDAMHYWKEAYYEKYPRREHTPIRKKDTTIYFLSNGHNMESIIDYEQIHKDIGKLKGDEFWQHQTVVRKLQRFKGTLSDDGTSVSVHVTYGQAHQGKVKIPTSITVERKLWNKTVFFVIGFSWMTPKAFHITPNDVSKELENTPVSEQGHHMTSSASTSAEEYRPATQAPLVERRVLTQPEYWRQRYEIQKELSGIDALRSKLEKQRRPANKAEKKQLQKEEKLKKRIEELREDRVNEIASINDQSEQLWRDF